jgi:hypothetical protein
MDIEQPVRRQLIDILSPIFTCFEEVALTSMNEKTVRADVLAISNTDCRVPVILAFEVKAHDNSDPGKYKDALFQASKYVNAVIADTRIVGFQNARVDAVVVFPAPAYRWPTSAEKVDPSTYVLTGIAFMAERLNVGRLVQRKTDWEIIFGANDLWSKNKGWMGNAETRFRDKGIVTGLKKERIGIAQDGSL